MDPNYEWKACWIADRCLASMHTFRERAWHKLARMLPRRLLYWSVVYSFTDASVGTYRHLPITALTAIQVLTHLER